MKLGTDPEFFLVDQTTNRPVPAHHYFAGNKEEPVVINDHVSLLTDNVMLEANITPAESKEEFVKMINHLKAVIRGLLPDGIYLVFNAEADFSGVDVGDKFMEFGCDPDWNVYTQQTNEYDITDSNVRYAGGHLHVSFDGGTGEKAELVKMLDETLYEPLKDYNTSGRDDYYGERGNFRFKPYGIEYRSLSCNWLSRDFLIEKVWDGAEQAIKRVTEKEAV